MRQVKNHCALNANRVENEKDRGRTEKIISPNRSLHFYIQNTKKGNRNMKEDFTKDDDEKKPAGKKDRLELAPGVEPSADLVTKTACEKDRLKLAP
jgi:preprotein translocase subunit SecD